MKLLYISCIGRIENPGATYANISVFGRVASREEARGGGGKGWRRKGEGLDEGRGKGWMRKRERVG